MQLAYYKDRKGNFGDDLNPWLWSKVFPQLMGTREDVVLVGMGTILEGWFAKSLPEQQRKVVLGAGAGMTLPLLTTDHLWTFYGVRGPLTARYLGLAPSCALTDPAMCIGQWIDLAPKRTRVGFMPHHHSLAKWDWRTVCEQAGLVYLDPRADPLETLDLINGLEKVVTEAMHGAIVADALRVPWVPLRTNQWNYVGKWDDWASTIRLPIHFRVLPELYDPVLGKSAVERIQWQVRVLARRQSPASSHRLVSFVQRELVRIAEQDSGHLSGDAELAEVVSKFMEAAHRLQADLNAL